jgi:hypothetical protein
VAETRHGSKILAPCLQGRYFGVSFYETPCKLARGLLATSGLKDGAKLCAAIPLLRRIPRMQENPHVIAGGKPAAHLVELQTVT